MAENLFDLTGKVALVTGGNSGLGFGYARGIARAGGEVMIWGRDEERNLASVKELQGFGGRVESAVVDVSDEGQVARGIQSVVASFGRLDCVFANAGPGSSAATIFDIDAADYQRMIGTAQHGVFYTLREAARHMVARAEAGDPGGSLVATGSLSNFFGLPGVAHYAAAKGAAACMIRSMAVEFGKYGVRANMVVAGYFRTGLQAGWDEQVVAATDAYFAQGTPIPRVGMPADLEGVAVYLASDMSSFHSGDMLVVDGGRRVNF